MSGQWVYPAIAILGVVFSSYIWSVLIRQRDFEVGRRLGLIYLMALLGALLGAKLVYLAAEGWMILDEPPPTGDQLLLSWLTGKSITGALLGGYLGVEIAKAITGYTRATGDLFGVIVPMGLVLGRVGCLLHGCCLGVVCEAAWYTIADSHGVHRWPSVPVELGFNAFMFAGAVTCWRGRWLQGQVFHVYLISYGLFRFGHEFARATPRILGPVSGYHIAALCVVVLGVFRYWQRSQGKAQTDSTVASV